MFEHILANGLLAGARRILDLGCGQGLLAALLIAARRRYDAGDWPGWPPPPPGSGVRGIELMTRDVERAHLALGASARIEHGDIRDADFGQVDAVVILDVLHYISYEAQEDVLGRVHQALPSGGRLLLRIGDADGGLGFRVSQWVDAVVTLARGHRLSRLYCRPVAQWIAVLESMGFSAQAQPMSEGTPFANVLLLAERR